MSNLLSITGELHWKTPLTAVQVQTLRGQVPSDGFITATWLDLTRIRTADKPKVFWILHHLADMVPTTAGKIQFTYTELTFEFFYIQDGRLHRQDASVQWNPKQVIRSRAPVQPADQYEYDGLLKLPNLTKTQLEQLDEISDRYGTPYYEHETNRIYFRYSSSDFNRWYTDMMSEIAAVVQEAYGDILCRLQKNDSDEPDQYERYQMLEGQLLVQYGALIQHPPQVISKP